VCCREKLFDAPINNPKEVFEDALLLYEAQGVIFIDSGLVFLEPSFVTDLVRPLVDHQLKDDVESGKTVEDLVAFRNDSQEAVDVDSLMVELDEFVASAEIASWPILSFLWRDIKGLDKKHYPQVIEMLVASGVILTLKFDGENDAVAIVPLRLAKEAEPLARARFWPALKPEQQRELELVFWLFAGCPAGLAELFASEAHRFGTSLHCWVTGVVTRSVTGPVVCTERVKEVYPERVKEGIVFKVRFNSDEEAAAWNLLSEANRLLESQGATRFPGLCYGARLRCEDCVKAKAERVEELPWSSTKRVFRCGHMIQLGIDDVRSSKAVEKREAVHSDRQQRAPTLLIVTTAGAEMEAVIDILGNEKLDSIDGIPVRIGEYGGRLAAVCQTSQGNLETYAVVSKILGSDKLKHSVKFVLPVGFAWGAKPEANGGDQRIGDVIVAEAYINAGHVRAGHGEQEIRGAVPKNPLRNSINSLLCMDWPGRSQTRFAAAISIPDAPRRPKVHIGTVISLPALIDDAATATYWLQHPQVAPHRPIGGEMELYQIVAAADECGVKWLLVKAICDFAGLAGLKDKEGQRLAAAAAAHFADWFLRQKVMDSVLRSDSTDI